MSLVSRKFSGLGERSRREPAFLLYKVGVLIYYVYILYSPGLDRYYVGHTHDIRKRLSYHNSGRGGTYTSKGFPWELCAVFRVGYSRSEAVRVERKIKQKKSRRFIACLISGDCDLGDDFAQLVRVPSSK